MDRLTLPSRPKTAEKEKCLPAGDGLPVWSEVPLYAKLPVYPTPKGSFKLCTTGLCEPKHKTTHLDFDLTDPCGHVTFSQYEPLHDPHLRNHFNVPRMRRHLVRNGFLHNGKVVCNLKEFNKYRQYLRKMFLLDLAYERQKERCRLEATRAESKDLEEDSSTKKRLEIVRNRLDEMNKKRKKRYEENRDIKSARLRERLQQMESERLLRETRNRQRERKRRHTLQQHRDMVDKRNKLLMRRWKMQERQRQRRLHNARMEQIKAYNEKIQESWEQRKKNQEIMMQKEKEAHLRNEEEKNKSIALRERRINAMKQRLQEELEKIREKKKLEQEAKEMKHARKLSERLALADMRNMARRNYARRRGRKTRYRSMWSIVSSLRRMEIKEQKSERFLQMLTSACDEISIFIEETPEDDEWDNEVDQEEFFQLKAREIVMSVYDQVKTNFCTKQVPSKGHIRFREKNSIIPDESSETLREYKSTEEHVVTPVPSAYELEALNLVEEKEEEFRRQEEMKLAESLLQRLLSDLNAEKLERDDVIKLTEYCVEMIKKKDYKRAVEDDVSVGDLNEYQMTGLADNLVKFTLESLLNDVKKGQVSQEDLTKLTLSVVGSSDETSTENVDKQIEKFINDMLNDITEDKELHAPSPINDVMLDNFIIITLKTLADDVEGGRLSKEMIEEMLNLMTAELDSSILEITEDCSFRTILHKIIEELESDKSDSLYRVVHAFVTSYLSFKESSQESLEELVSRVIQRIQSELGIEKEGLQSLTSLSKELSTQSLSIAQVSSIANNLLRATSQDKMSYTEIAKLIVNDAIELAKAAVEKASSSNLVDIASTLTTSIDNVLHEPSSAKPSREDSFTTSVSTFVTDVLQMVFSNLQKGHFTDSDVAEMMSSVNRIVDSRQDKHSILANHIKSIVNEISSGALKKEDLQEIGQELIFCGRKLLGKLSGTDISVTSRNSTRTPSFTSTAIADDMVGHLLQSLQIEFQRGQLDHDALKNLALCILRSTSTCSDLNREGTKSDDFFRTSTTKFPSPCDSHIAEGVVKTTLGQIIQDIDEGKLTRFSLVSIASSAMSVFSNDSDKMECMNTLMHSVLSRLREDNLSVREVKALFRAILRKYQFEHDVMFPRTEPVSADSELAESLIRETMMKIDRDIRSGNYTDDDMIIFAEESRRMGCKDLKQASEDVVNFILSIIQQLKSQIGERVEDEKLTQFLQIASPDFDNIRTRAEILIAFDKILCDISINRHRSPYVLRILRHFGSHSEDEVTAIGDMLKSVNIGVLSNFVKMTISGVLNDIRKSRTQSADLTVDTSFSDAGLLIQTASSAVANKLVRNLLSRIEKTVLSGQPLSSDVELAQVGSETKVTRRFEEIGITGLSSDLMLRISSNEIGAHILDTLNNLISNMRLDRSVERFQHLSGDEMQRKMSSGMIEDFVLGTLQDIVESMQDQLSYSDLQDTCRIREEASKTSIFVMDTINDILKEMAEEIRTHEEQRRHEGVRSAERDTSTASLEAEAVVVGALHNIVYDFVGEEDANRITLNSFKFDPEARKRRVIGTLENIKKDIGSPNGAATRVAVSEIIQSTVTDEHDEVDNFVEETIDMIIKTINENKLKTNDSIKQGTSQSSVESTDTLDLVIVPSENSAVQVDIDGRSVSLLKMAEMTSRMLKVYDESNPSPGQELVGNISREKMEEILSEAVSRTLSNIERGQLSLKEVNDLANALSERYSVDALGENDVDFASETSTARKDVEYFVVASLEKVNQELHEGGIDDDRMRVAVQSITNIGISDSTSKSSTISSVPSGVITQLVKTVLSNIANNFSDEELVIGENKKQQHGSVKSLSSQSSGKTTGSSTTKANVNPNAALRLLSAHSHDFIERPMKSTPVPLLHSYCDVSTLHTKQDSALLEVEKKPTCMVAPQKSAQKTTTSKKTNRQGTTRRQSTGRTSTFQHVGTPIRRETNLPHISTTRRPNVNQRQPSPKRVNQKQERGKHLMANERSSSVQNHPTTKQINLTKELQKRSTSTIGKSTENSSDKKEPHRNSKAGEKGHTTTEASQNKQTSTPTKAVLQRHDQSEGKKNPSSGDIALTPKRNEQLHPSPKRYMSKERTGQSDGVSRVKSTVSSQNSPGIRKSDQKSGSVKHSPKNLKPNSAKRTTYSQHISPQPSEVRSLCGSHKTRISVRDSPDVDSCRPARPPFH